MRQIIILIGILLLVVEVKGENPKPLSFNEAVMLAYDANVTLKSAEGRLDIARYEQQATKGLYYPKIEIVGGYILTQRDVAIDLSGVKGDVESVANDIINSGVASGVLTPGAAQLIGGLLSPLSALDWRYVIQGRSLGVTAAKVTAPIYMGGRIRAANRAAVIRRRVAEESVAMTRSHLYTTLVEQYYGVVVLSYAVSIRESVVEVMQQHLSDAEAMEEVGEVAHSVTLGAQYRLSQAESELVAERHKLKMAQRLLCSTLKVDYDVTLLDNIFIDKAILPIDFYIDSAVNLNQLLHQAELGKELAQEGVKVARAALLPEVAAVGGVSLYSPNLSDMIPRWAVGIEARITLFDGLAKERRLQAAKREVDVVEREMEKARSDIVLLVENEYYNIMNALESISTAEASIDLAESYYQSAYDGFKAGVTSSTELMDAEVNRAASKLLYLDAVYQYTLSLARLLEVSGLTYLFEQHREYGSIVYID
jgi:outer membrane protein TolC